MRNRDGGSVDIESLLHALFAVPYLRCCFNTPFGGFNLVSVNRISKTKGNYHVVSYCDRFSGFMCPFLGLFGKATDM